MKYIMKQISLALYSLGHLISITTMEVSWLGFTYHIYNKLMGWSLAINDKYGFDVWEAGSTPKCKHNWVDGRNQIVGDVLICDKCHKVKGVD